MKWAAKPLKKEKRVEDMDIGIEIPRQARPKRKGSVIAGLATAAVIAAGWAAPLHATILENVQRDELIAKIAAAPQENLPPGRSPSRSRP